MKRFALEKLKIWKEKPETTDHPRSQTGWKNLADERVRKDLF